MYKICTNKGAMSKRHLYKFLLIMQSVSIFLLVCLMQVSAATFGQYITLKQRNASLEYVLREIRKQSHYDIIYDLELIEKAKPVNIQVSGVSLDAALKRCFFNQPLTYSIDGKTITIKDIERKEMIALSSKDFLAAIDVRGKVVDERGKPMSGVTVRLMGSSRTAITNAEGDFYFEKVDEKSKLIISYLGYKAQEIPVKAHVGTIKMSPSSDDLEEVVITTGIFNKAKESFTGASTTINAEELQRFGTRNLVTSIRNIDPSFNIIESNAFGSNPNRLPEIQIRGNSSIPNVGDIGPGDLKDQARAALNTPLIILDGFETTLQKLLDINENEVASITILKDASATAIYGSRGSNGVVVITTKLPKAGKLRVSYRGDVNFEAPDLSDYNLLNAREKLDLEWKAGYFDAVNVQTDVQLKDYYNYWVNEVNSGVNTDWLAIPLRNGVGQRHNLRLEGGDQALRYSASVQVNDIQGVMKESARKIFNGSISLSYLYKDVKFNNNLQISQANASNSPYGSFADYAVMNPYRKPFDDDGNVVKIFTEYRGSFNFLRGNPLYNATLNTFDKSGTSDITNNTSVEWSILKGLLLRSQVGITKTVGQTDQFRPADHTAFANYVENDVFRKGDYTYGISNGLRYAGSLNASYTVNFDKHTVFAGLDYSIRESNSSSYSFLAEGFNNPNFDFISMALQFPAGGKPSGSESLTRSIGLTGNLNYIYNNRYFIDGSFRFDGSSQFGSKKRFAPFWSMGFGWNVHEESFLVDNSFIDRLKLRGSTGITGSQNFSAYQALATYRYYTDDRYYNWNGAYLLGLGNEELRWQQALKNNIGIDAEFLQRRLRVTGDYYIETTRDLVSSVNLPASNGFPNYIANIGKMRNKGFELKVTAFILNQGNEGFTWSVTGAVVQNRNKVIETSQALKDAQKVIQDGAGSPGMMYVEGYSSNVIWVVPSLGIDPSNGKELFMDASGRPTYTWSGNDVKAMGTTEPRYFGNFSSMLRYKGLTLNASFGYRYGGQQYNSTLVNKVESSDYRLNVDQRVYDDRWQKPGDHAAFKGLLNTTATNKSSRFVQDENVLTCQNISLRYEVSAKKLLQSLNLNAFNISANMADAFQLSSIQRERGTSYPFSRQISMSINATF
ncbi:SusC/RagA family TonB-linked outer membrane protein [Sphingobacterium luzhongxinii]|uniref:SusC/RagA family TonB-linked outer membrane protein n=1 Tax=Sphingobacterium luzhongxinii TaxID=2654181 RepID=UPI001969B4D8|nr:SusC/RagA family TonB-linked outer membrane protein [Sphingobacterium sp. xlx-73]